MTDLQQLRAALQAPEGSDREGLWTDHWLNGALAAVDTEGIREDSQSQYRVWMAAILAINELWCRPRRQILLPLEIQREYATLHVRAQHEVLTIRQREVERGNQPFSPIP